MSRSLAHALPATQIIFSTVPKTPARRVLYDQVSKTERAALFNFQFTSAFTGLIKLWAIISSSWSHSSPQA